MVVLHGLYEPPLVSLAPSLLFSASTPYARVQSGLLQIPELRFFLMPLPLLWSRPGMPSTPASMGHILSAAIFSRNFLCLLPRPRLRSLICSLGNVICISGTPLIIQKWFVSSMSHGNFLTAEEMLLPSVLSGPWHRACNILNAQLNSMKVDSVFSLDPLDNPGKLVLFPTVLVNSESI